MAARNLYLARQLSQNRGHARRAGTPVATAQTDNHPRARLPPPAGAAGVGLAGGGVRR